MIAFEILDDMVVVCGAADLRDTEVEDQLFFGYDGGTRGKSAMLGGQGARSIKTLLWSVHGSSSAFPFLKRIDQNQA